MPIGEYLKAFQTSDIHGKDGFRDHGEDLSCSKLHTFSPLLRLNFLPRLTCSSAGSHGAIANATSTVTVANSEPTITTVVTKTPAMSVLTIISTSTVSKSHITTTTATIPSPVPTRIGGFAAIEYEDEWTGDLSVSLFWVDDHGDIKQLDSDSTTASGWNDAGKFTSHVRVGSAVCHVYASDSNYVSPLLSITTQHQERCN
jgi:hypothetical protein